MNTCANCEKGQSEAVPENVMKVAIEEINDILAQEGPAADYASSQEVYEQLLVTKKKFFVSEEHVVDPDLGRTFYAVAEDEEAYKAFIENIDRQHLPGGLTPGLSPAEALHAEVLNG